jgi:hypothetical protein
VLPLGLAAAAVIGVGALLLLRRRTTA